MTDIIKVDVIGTKETISFLKTQNKNKIHAAGKAILQAAFYIEGEVKEAIAGRRSPLPRRVDTGNYKSSVHAKQIEELASVVESTIEYAKYVEHGTSKMKPGQHFAVTRDRNIGKVKAFVDDAINK